MRIGELGQRAGVSPETVRYYEHIGVLPAPPRTAGGYRDYDESVLARLRFIRAAQAVGLTLGQIREIIAFRDDGQAPCALVLDLIQRRASEVSERIAELERIRRELEEVADQARSLRPEDCPEATVCHLITGGPTDGRRLEATAARPLVGPPVRT